LFTATIGILFTGKIHILFTARSVSCSRQDLYLVHGKIRILFTTKIRIFFTHNKLTDNFTTLLWSMIVDMPRSETTAVAIAEFALL
jgi:hypothetical protein